MESISIKDSLEIILITYNRAQNLEKTLSTILAENSPIKDFEITIIDNNSTDNTFSIVKRFKESFSNLHYEKNKYNIGGNANIMKAFYKASKKYIWVLADNDEYSWQGWSEVEESIKENKDAIIVSNYECPSYNIAQLFIQASFLPGVIYKTSLINDEVMVNMAFNIANMFPHLALAAKIINENLEYSIVNNWIVKLGENKDEITGIYKYTRGYEDSQIHPWMKDMHWLTGYANSLPLIRDKKIRDFIISHNQFVFTRLDTARVFFYNSDDSKNSLYNLLCIFCILPWFKKLKFLLDWVLFYSLYSIIYISSEYKRTENPEQEFLIKQYNLRLFRFLKTKLFRVKIKNKMR